MRALTLTLTLLLLLTLTSIASLLHHSHLLLASLWRLQPQPALEWQLLVELRLPRLLVRLLGADQDGNRLILSGLAVSTLLGSLLTLLITMLPDGSLRIVTFWLMGSFASVEWPQALLMLLAAPLVWLALFRQWRFLNALQLGESTAFHLGFAVRRLEWRIVMLAALATGLVVSGCGMIGFIGLMAPHLARQLLGSDSRRLLLAAPLLGAWLAVSSDWLARGLLAPAELPVGVITSLLGAPFFLWLLRRQERRHA